jgi:hypothetical protein
VDREELGVLSRYPAVSRRLLTADEYHRMAEAGILTEEDDVELIEGELVAIAPIGGEHVATTNALTRLLVMAVGDRGIAALLDDRSRPNHGIHATQGTSAKRTQTYVGFQPTNRERWMRRGDLQSCATKASLAGWKPTLRSLSLLRCYLQLPSVKYMIPKNRGKADCHND